MAATQGSRSTAASDAARLIESGPTPGTTDLQTRRTSWRRLFVVAVVAATAAWVAGALAGQTHGIARLAWIGGGAVLTAIAVGVPLWSQRRAAIAGGDAVQAAWSARAAMKIALEDALDPLAHLVAALADAPAADEPRMRGEAISLGVGTAVQLADTDRVRACFFSYGPGPPPSLRPERFSGRAGAPATVLTEGTRAGNAALRALSTNTPVYVSDTAERPGWWGTPDEYGTFLAVPVSTATMPLGMLTLDALRPGALARVDLALIRLLASLLAAALRL